MNSENSQKETESLQDKFKRLSRTPICLNHHENFARPDTRMYSGLGLSSWEIKQKPTQLDNVTGSIA